MGALLCCFGGKENKQFCEDLKNNSFRPDELIQHRISFPKYRFLVYALITVLCGVLAVASEANQDDEYFGSWFWAVGLFTATMSLYYPTMIAITGQHFAIRMQLLKLLCINSGWVVFKKTDVVCISESYQDLNSRACCQSCKGPYCCCCLGFEDWADLNREPTQRTLTFQFDKSVSWGEFLTVTLAVHEAATSLSGKTGIRVDNQDAPGSRSVAQHSRPAYGEGGV